MATYNTSPAPQTINFDSLEWQDFDSVAAASIPVNTAISTIQAILPLATACKIYTVAVGYLGTVTATLSMQILTGNGNGASYSVGTADTVAPAATSLWAAPVVIPPGLAGTNMLFIPDNYDVIYQSSTWQPTSVYTNAPATVNQGPLLTLRFITNGTGTLTTGPIKVVLGMKPYNNHQDATMLPSPSGFYGFDPTSFLP
jgi:hypothetical protein